MMASFNRVTSGHVYASDVGGGFSRRLIFIEVTVNWVSVNGDGACSP